MAPDAAARNLAAALRRAIPDAEITSSSAVLDEHATDFGRVAWGRARVVARPRSTEAVEALVRFALENGIQIGCQAAAHSQGGQSLVQEGILLDVRSLQGLERVGDDRFVAAAGTLWRDVLFAALQEGRVPPVLTTNLFTTVGGTHSVGGVGHSSFRAGPQVDSCLELEVVTGTGERVTASSDRDSELFHAALGGLGQVGIITRVTHRLRAHGSHIRSLRLVFRDRSRMLAAARALTDSDAVDYLNMEVVPVGGRWLYVLVANREMRGEHEAAPDPLERAIRESTQVLMDRVSPFPLWATAGRGGPPPPRSLQPGTIRPGIDVFLPAPAADRFHRELRSLLPTDLQSAALLLVLLVSAGGRGRTLLQLPDGDDLELLSVLPTVAAAEGPRLLPLLERAIEIAAELGGRQYPAGWTRSSVAAWREHYGAELPRVAALRARYDPGGILAPALPHL